MLELLHPVVVHFPVALLPVALVFDLALRLLKVRAGTAIALVDALVLLGGLGAVCAAVTGDAALHSLSLDGARGAAAHEHERAAGVAVWTAVAAVLSRGMWRLASLSRRGRPEPIGVQRTLHAVSLVLLAASSAAALRAGHLGGVLVHDHGVTRATVPHRAPERPAGADRYESER